MSDFSGDAGMAKLNSRYHFWTNVGALIAPLMAVAVATRFGNRSAFFLSSAIYFGAWVWFRYMRLSQETKKITPVNPRRTVRALVKNLVAFFRTPGMRRAYLVNFGFYSLRAMRYLYVPIVVIENGFSKDTLGLVLSLGIIPYLLLSNAMARLVRRFGKKFWLILGFGSFAVFSAGAMFITGYPVLAIFVLWQFSGAFMEPVHDLLFFDNTKKVQQT